MYYMFTCLYSYEIKFLYLLLNQVLFGVQAFRVIAIWTEIPNSMMLHYMLAYKCYIYIMICLGTPPLKHGILISDHLGWHSQTPKSTIFLTFPTKKNQPLTLKVRAASGKTGNSMEREMEMEVAHRRALAIKRVKEEAAACEDCLRDFSLFTTNARGGATTLFTQSWTPVSVKVRGVIVLLHGLNEHSRRYGVFAKLLNANGFKVIGIDSIDGTPPKSHPGLGPKHRYVEDRVEHQSASKPTWIFAMDIVTGVMVGSLLLMALFLAVQRFPRRSSIIIPWKKILSGKDHITICIDPWMLNDVVRYNRQELEVACKDFSNIIGLSSDSLVYKGIIKGGPEIAVICICIKEEQWTGYLELYFQKEVADLARLNHKNARKLLGYCRESSPFTRMMVFEYASNGTLYENLYYGEGCQLSWTR